LFKNIIKNKFMNIITGFSRAVNGGITNPGEILSLLIK
jgi:hypothetical protein